MCCDCLKVFSRENIVKTDSLFCPVATDDQNAKKHCRISEKIKRFGYLNDNKEENLQLKKTDNESVIIIIIFNLLFNL